MCQNTFTSCRNELRIQKLIDMRHQPVHCVNTGSDCRQDLIFTRLAMIEVVPHKSYWVVNCGSMRREQPGWLERKHALK